MKYSVLHLGHNYKMNISDRHCTLFILYSAVAGKRFHHLSVLQLRSYNIYITYILMAVK